MAEYQDRTGYNVGIVGGSGGSEPPDTIEAQWIRKLERDLWVRFWGPGPICTDWDDKDEYDRGCGWNQSASYDAGTSGSGTSSAGMGDMSGNPDSHISAGGSGSNPISTSDPRDATGYGKYTVDCGGGSWESEVSWDLIYGGNTVACCFNIRRASNRTSSSRVTFRRQKAVT